VSEIQRLKELEKENGRLKRLLAERVLEIDLLKELVAKTVTRNDKRAAVRFLVAGGLSVHGACLLVSLAHATFH
jgi:hypothetical protein